MSICIDALPLLLQKASDSQAFVPDAPRATQLTRQGLAATGSSTKVSLLQSASGITRARKTYPTRCKPDGACLVACLAEAASGTKEYMIRSIYILKVKITRNNACICSHNDDILHRPLTTTAVRQRLHVRDHTRTGTDARNASTL